MTDPVQQYHTLIDEYHRIPEDNRPLRQTLQAMAAEARKLALELVLKSSRVRWSYHRQPKVTRNAD